VGISLWRFDKEERLDGESILMGLRPRGGRVRGGGRDRQTDREKERDRERE
jgi:hypothetical protein